MVRWVRQLLVTRLFTFLIHARVSTYCYKLREEGISAAGINEKATESLSEICFGKLADVLGPLHNYSPEELIGRPV